MTLHICKKCGQEFKQNSHYWKHVNKRMCVNNNYNRHTNTSKYRNKDNMKNCKDNAPDYKKNTNYRNDEEQVIFRNKVIQIIKKIDSKSTNIFELGPMHLSLNPSNKSKSKIIILTN